MTPVVIESPFAGENKAEESLNRAYLDACIRDCINRDETPYASHKMLVDALDDGDHWEREKGIEAGFDIGQLIAKKAFYVDRGWSYGMKCAKAYYDEQGIGYVTRKVEGWVSVFPNAGLQPERKVKGL